MNQEETMHTSQLSNKSNCFSCLSTYLMHPNVPVHRQAYSSQIHFVQLLMLQAQRACGTINFHIHPYSTYFNMTTTDLNKNLIEAIKEKLPVKENIANTLMDTLFIGKEAIYRRLRGEVPFTLEEAALISRKIGISLDNIVGVSYGDNALFNLNIVNQNDPFNTYYEAIAKYLKVIQASSLDESSELGTASNTIPQTIYLKYGLLAKFRLFKWMYQSKHIQCKHFDELIIPQKISDIQQEYVQMAQHIHTVDYILDNTIFQHLVNDLHYFYQIQLITAEDKQQIKEELLQLIDELEEIATTGKTESGSHVRIYISNINFEATYSYLSHGTFNMSLIRIYSINSISTQDNDMFHSIKEWIQSLKKFSTLISESGEMQRIHFFQQQRDIINTI